MNTITASPPERASADPRPELVERDGEFLLTGSRCGDCSHAMAVVPPRCPVCGGSGMAETAFGPKGTVFSSTVLRIPVPGRTPPFALAYVDLDDGPRILAHVDGSDEALVPNSRVVLAGWSEHGDPAVRKIGP